MKILIAEDDPHILLGLEELLKIEGFDVASCNRGDLVMEAVAEHVPDLLVLDVMLPGKSGYDVCRELRKSDATLPILMLTAKGQELDKVVGLELGADDYVTKPFGVRELLARIQALLRRTSQARENTAHTFAIGTATVDPKRFEVRAGGVTRELTPRELKLLRYFHAHPGEVLSRDQILNEVWGYNYFGTTRTLDQAIAQLRKKIGDDGQHPRIIVTLHGVGYRLAV